MLIVHSVLNKFRTDQADAINKTCLHGKAQFTSNASLQNFFIFKIGPNNFFSLGLCLNPLDAKSSKSKQNVN
jgi:hypothetical protein